MKDCFVDSFKGKEVGPRGLFLFLYSSHNKKTAVLKPPFFILVWYVKSHPAKTGAKCTACFFCPFSLSLCIFIVPQVVPAFFAFWLDGKIVIKKRGPARFPVQTPALSKAIQREGEGRKALTAKIIYWLAQQQPRRQP